MFLVVGFVHSSFPGLVLSSSCPLPSHLTSCFSTHSSNSYRLGVVLPSLLPFVVVFMLLVCCAFSLLFCLSHYILLSLLRRGLLLLLVVSYDF